MTSTKSWESTACRHSRCFPASRIISTSSYPTTRFRGLATSGPSPNACKPAWNVGSQKIFIDWRGTARRARDLAARGVPDRVRPRGREAATDLCRLQVSRTASGKITRGFRIHAWRSCIHYYDQSVEMVDFGVCDFSLRWHAGAPGLQTKARRAMETAPTLGRQRFDHRISDLAPIEYFAGAERWESAKGTGHPAFMPRTRADLACIVYSSGTGGAPKGCMMTHENYLEQCVALTAWYPFWPGVKYLSILPTNHAIDFMVGFFGPFTCGAAVVHLRTLLPEFVREAFAKYQITYVSLVPLVLKNLHKGLEARFDALTRSRRRVFEALRSINKALTKDRPRLALSRRLLNEVHQAFGGKLEAIIVGGAFTEPQTLQFFYDLGIPVANGYGLTEAGTAVTVNDLKPFRADTVGKPLPGMEVKIVDPAPDGVGEVWVRGKTVMSGYLDDPELTAEAIVEGWLRTGDLGRFDPQGHLHLSGRKKNMIVTEEGKNIYPEDIEKTFEGLPVKEFCVFAANYIWPKRSMT